MVSRKNNRPEDGNFQNKKNKRIKIENSGAEVLDSKSIITKVIVKIEAESLVLKLKEPLTGIKLRNTTELRNTTKIPRPTPEECKYVTDALSALHPDVVERSSTRRKTLLEACGMRNSITDSIVSTMLSQNTTDANSKAAFKNLKEKFKDWESLVKCDDMSEIEDAIRVAGLARTRAERIHRMLSTVLKDKGELSMEFLRDFSDEEGEICIRFNHHNIFTYYHHHTITCPIFLITHLCWFIDYYSSQIIFVRIQGSRTKNHFMCFVICIRKG